MNLLCLYGIFLSKFQNVSILILARLSYQNTLFPIIYSETFFKHLKQLNSVLKNVGTLQNIFIDQVLGLQLCFRRFSPKFEALFLKSDYLLFKVLSVASQYFFPSFWKLSDTISKKRCAFWGDPRIGSFFDFFIRAEMLMSQAVYEVCPESIGPTFIKCDQIGGTFFNRVLLTFHAWLLSK